MKNNETDTEYYLNYRDSLVHDLIDYIEGYSKYNSKFENIMRELMIENDNSNKLDYNLKYVTKDIFWNYYNEHSFKGYYDPSPKAIDFIYDKLMSNTKPIVFITKIKNKPGNSGISDKNIILVDEYLNIFDLCGSSDYFAVNINYNQDFHFSNKNMVDAFQSFDRFSKYQTTNTKVKEEVLIEFQNDINVLANAQMPICYNVNNCHLTFDHDKLYKIFDINFVNTFKIKK